MYKHLRLVTCASLIVFIGIVGVGGLVLLQHAVVASVPASKETARRDPSPASEARNMERDASPRISMSAPPSRENASEAPPAAEKEAQQRPSATEQTATSSPQSATSPPKVPQQSDAPEQAVRRDLPQVKERHAQMPAPNAQAKVQPRVAAAKKTAHQAAEKRRRNEALNSVRRFGDQQRDIPVSAYAADGMRRTIPIRPTSIQDVYYYSVPR